MGRYAGVDLGNLVFNSSIAQEAAVKLAPKTSAITKDEALKISSDFASYVRERIDPEAIVFVFGSTVRGTASLNSVVSRLQGTSPSQDPYKAEFLQLMIKLRNR